jgi:branched-chain amino acid transport system permease protein
MTIRLLGIAAFLLLVFVLVPWGIAASGRTDFYYTLTSVALLAIRPQGLMGKPWG